MDRLVYGIYLPASGWASAPAVRVAAATFRLGPGRLGTLGYLIVAASLPPPRFAQFSSIAFAGREKSQAELRKIARRHFSQPLVAAISSRGLQDRPAPT